MLAFQNAPGGNLELPGIKARLESVHIIRRSLICSSTSTSGVRGKGMMASKARSSTGRISLSGAPWRPLGGAWLFVGSHCRRPQRPIGWIDILDLGERRQLL